MFLTSFHQSKEVTQALRNFEESLLNSYKIYIDYLIFIIKQKKQPKQQKNGFKGELAAPLLFQS